jgi:hypothetical protein
VKAELDETKSKLSLCKTIELFINGSAQEVSNKLHEIGDYSPVRSWIQSYDFWGQSYDFPIYNYNASAVIG